MKKLKFIFFLVIVLSIFFTATAMAAEGTYMLKNESGEYYTENNEDAVFDTLASAITAVNGDYTIIELQEDCSLSKSYYITTSFTLTSADSNADTEKIEPYTLNTGNYVFCIQAGNQTLTLKDIKIDGNQMMQVKAGGNLDLLDGVILPDGLSMVTTTNKYPSSVNFYGKAELLYIRTDSATIPTQSGNYFINIFEGAEVNFKASGSTVIDLKGYFTFNFDGGIIKTQSNQDVILAHSGSVLNLNGGKIVHETRLGNSGKYSVKGESGSIINLGENFEIDNQTGSNDTNGACSLYIPDADVLNLSADFSGEIAIYQAYEGNVFGKASEGVTMTNSDMVTGLGEAAGKSEVLIIPNEDGERLLAWKCMDEVPYVCRIENEFYPSLEDALAEIGDGEGKINLLSDITLTGAMTIGTGGNIILDGSTGDEEDTKFDIIADFSANNAIVINNNTRIKLENVRLTRGSNADAGFTSGYVNIQYASTLEMGDYSEISGTEDKPIYGVNFGAVKLTYGAGDEAQFIMNGEEALIEYVESRYHGVIQIEGYQGSNGKSAWAQIINGTIRNCTTGNVNYGIVRVTKGKFELSGGVIDGGNAVALRVGAREAWTDGPLCLAVMTDGTITSTGTAVRIGAYDGTYGEISTFSISGGTIESETGMTIAAHTNGVINLSGDPIIDSGNGIWSMDNPKATITVSGNFSGRVKLNGGIEDTNSFVIAEEGTTLLNTDCFTTSVDTEFYVPYIEAVNEENYKVTFISKPELLISVSSGVYKNAEDEEKGIIRLVTTLGGMTSASPIEYAGTYGIAGAFGEDATLEGITKLHKIENFAGFDASKNNKWMTDLVNIDSSLYNTEVTGVSFIKLKGVDTPIYTPTEEIMVDADNFVSDITKVK
ncbi:MAG: hypothetical protein Q4G23_02315 [Clostridia bacterium]|nr:hypothetical protein [Clostridia bacterium]